MLHTPLASLLSRSENDAHVRSAALNSVTTTNVTQVLAAYQSLAGAEQNAGSYRRLLEMMVRRGDSSSINKTLLSLPSVDGTSRSAVDAWVAVLNILDRAMGSGPLLIPPAAMAGIQRGHTLALRDIVDDENRPVNDSRRHVRPATAGPPIRKIHAAGARCSSMTIATARPDG